MKPIVVEVNADKFGEAVTRMVRLDDLRCGYRVGLNWQINGALGNGSVSIEYSFDDPNDLVSPIPVDQMAWLNDMSPVVDGRESGAGSLPVAPTWVRCRLNGTQGSVKMAVIQYRHGSAM